jgi:hypothetical protein
MERYILGSLGITMSNIILPDTVKKVLVMEIPNYGNKKKDTNQ